MSLSVRIMNEIKTAMRAKDTVALESLRAVKSAILLAQTETGSKEEISEEEEIKILQRLVKADIIKSIKGNGGGFEIEKAQLKQIKLDQLVKAIDGNDLFDRCSLGLHDCSDKQPCPFHHKYKPLRENLKKTLRETSLLDLISEFNTGETFLKL